MFDLGIADVQATTCPDWYFNRPCTQSSGSHIITWTIVFETCDVMHIWPRYGVMVTKHRSKLVTLGTFHV